MWAREFVGTSVLMFVEQFILYSIMGWFVESIYMSICNRKLTNRGFGVGPFCPIYGFGAVIGYLILNPLRRFPVALYVVAAFSATVFEFIVANLMKRYLGEVWWDYNEKPYNYQGVICLESTIAWGFYGIIIVYWLNDLTVRILSMVPELIGKRVSVIILTLYMVDFIYHILDALDVNIRENLMEKKEDVMERYHSFRNRF